MSSTRYKIHGMDCADEVAVLAREVAPLVGGREHLRFDVLSGRMEVAVPVEGELDEAIRRAVAATGMTAQPWEEFCTSGVCAVEESFWRRKGRLVLVFASGGLLLLGFLLHGLFEGFRTALTSEGATPLPVALVYLASVVTGGWYIFPKALFAARRLRPDMNLLMTVAVIGAIFLGAWLEASAVTFLFALSLLLESWSVSRARRAVEALMSLAPPMARILHEEGDTEMVPAEAAVPGMKMIVRPGEKIPLDGVVTGGRSSVNQAPITGESLPVDVEKGGEVYAGTINGEGVLEIRVTHTAGDTTLARMIRLIEESRSHRAPSEQWVDRFARVYTPAMMFLAFAVAVIPPLLAGGGWERWIYEGLVILVIACPCALVISTPVSVVAGLASAARNGVLIKGGAYLEAPAHLRVAAFDKTGTLTEGRPRVKSLVPLNDHTEEELLAIAAAMERDSTHPLALAICEEAERRGLEVPPAEEHTA
ncbi:MAG TPA: HAD family hydrolase, partial [Bacteroidetes bacterium]|nr:HAD family hydrolase [Bacteroidota bacterium]